MVKIRSEKLTTCRVAADGEEVGLEFLDTSGAAVRLEMPVEQAEALIMTLPQLLAAPRLRQPVFASSSLRHETRVQPEEEVPDLRQVAELLRVEFDLAVVK